MRVQIVGYCVIDYINKQERHVQGLRLYCVSPSANRQVVGSEAFEVYVSGAQEVLPDVGDEVVLSYNRFGRCTGWFPG